MAAFTAVETNITDNVIKLDTTKTATTQRPTVPCTIKEFCDVTGMNYDTTRKSRLGTLRTICESLFCGAIQTDARQLTAIGVDLLIEMDQHYKDGGNSNSFEVMLIERFGSEQAPVSGSSTTEGSQLALADTSELDVLLGEIEDDYKALEVAQQNSFDALLSSVEIEKEQAVGEFKAVLAIESELETKIADAKKVKRLQQATLEKAQRVAQLKAELEELQSGGNG